MPRKHGGRIRPFEKETNDSVPYLLAVCRCHQAVNKIASWLFIEVRTQMIVGGVLKTSLKIALCLRECRQGVLLTYAQRPRAQIMASSCHLWV
jgi:hypothetical protein